jgi:hypothetical protein
MSESFPCIDCRQLIIKSESEVWPSGRPHIKNYVNGPGGLQGEDHLCPFRSGGSFDKVKIPDWKEYYILQSKKCCPLCAVIYFTTCFNLCPNCYKLKCRECGRLRSDRVGEYRCPLCLCMESDIIDHSRYCIMDYRF